MRENYLVNCDDLKFQGSLSKNIFFLLSSGKTHLNTENEVRKITQLKKYRQKNSFYSNWISF